MIRFQEQVNYFLTSVCFGSTHRRHITTSDAPITQNKRRLDVAVEERG